MRAAGIQKVLDSEAQLGARGMAKDLLRIVWGEGRGGPGAGLAGWLAGWLAGRLAGGQAIGNRPRFASLA